MEPRVVHFEGEALIHLPDAGDAPARIELVGGRDRHSVGGAIAEGPRWWKGRVEAESLPRVSRIHEGTEVRIELGSGRAARAVVVELVTGSTTVVSVRGVGPPPFEVP